MPADTPSRMRASLPLVLVLVSASLFGGAANAQPSFSQAFTPSTISVGLLSSLTFTIDNTAGTPVSGLSFSETLPAGMTLSTPLIASTTCLDGAVTATAGGSTIAFSNGRLGGGKTCVVRVAVTSSTVGTSTSTSSDLTSSAGSSAASQADLTIATGRPTFSLSLSPSTVPVGAPSTLTLVLDNSAGPGFVFNTNVSAALPSGLRVASLPRASSACNSGAPPTINAPAGAASFSLTGGFFQTGTICTVSFDVKTVAPGAHDLYIPNATMEVELGGAVARVEGVRRELHMLFQDDPVAAGGLIDVVYTLSQRNRFDTASSITFTHDLNTTLTGLQAVNLPLSNPCGAGSSLTGASLVTLSGGNLPPEGTCSFTVRLAVPSNAPTGTYSSTTSTVAYQVGGEARSWSAATDALTVEPVPVFTKIWTESPLAAGSVTTLRYVIENTSATFEASAVEFRDGLFQHVPDLTFTGTVTESGCGGAASVIAESFPPFGIAVSNVFIAAGDSCTLDVELDVPAQTVGGVYASTTEPLRAVINSELVYAPPASDSLEIARAPRLVRDFVDDPVAPGGQVTVSYTLSLNEHASAGVTDVTFTDDLSATLAGLTPSGGGADLCGAGSLVATDGLGSVTLTGGSLSPGESCSFTVIASVPADAPPGRHVGVPVDVFAQGQGLALVSTSNAGALDVSGIGFEKSFIDDPVAPGGVVTLEYTITNDTVDDATNLFFTEELNATLSGLAPVGPLPTDPCGPGSSLSDFGVLVLQDGVVPAGSSCVFAIELQVPAAAEVAMYPSVSSDLRLQSAGSSLLFPPAVDVLLVADPLLLASEILPRRARPGDEVTLRFTLANSDPTRAVTDLALTVDLDDSLTGLAASGLPASDVCGTGSVLSGAGFLSLSGASLPAGGTCSFDVSLLVPTAAPYGAEVVVVSSELSGLIEGVATTASPTASSLTIIGASFSASFDGPIARGGTAILSYTIENLSVAEPLMDLAFTHDLDTLVSGAAVSAPLPLNPCGAASSVGGTTLLKLRSGILGPSGSCTFEVPVILPVDAPLGPLSTATGELFSGPRAIADAATAQLSVEPAPDFSASFAPPVIAAGGASTLTYTIDNSASALLATDLSFAHDLPAGLLLAAVPNAAATCSDGTLSANAGEASLGYAGGSVAALATCTVRVDVVAAAAGTFEATTGALSSSSGDSGVASATLVVEPLPAFTAAFDPATILLEEQTTLSFLIDNGASAVAAADVAFGVSFPSGLEIAAAPPATSGCGSLTATGLVGGDSLAVTGAAIAPGESCEIAVALIASVAGNVAVTSSALATSTGTVPAAEASLVVSEPGVDAGPPVSDAGSPGQDAGTPPRDAGPPHDAGGGDTDPPADGCGCAATETGEGIPAGVGLALLALVLLRRRRR